MNLIEELKGLTAALDAEGIDYALCGGLAMAVYAMPRATLDIDIMVELDDFLRTQRIAKTLGFTLSGGHMTFANGQVKMYRLCKVNPDSEEELVLDVLIVTPETYSSWKDRKLINWEGGTLSVVSPQGLITLKSLRGSGQDQDDIRFLKEISDED